MVRSEPLAAACREIAAPAAAARVSQRAGIGAFPNPGVGGEKNQIASKAVFTISPATTRMNTRRISREPCRKASRVPRWLPMILAIAIGSTKGHQTLPVAAKITSDARFVVMLSTFALATACRKSNPSSCTKRKMKKLPVPGPKKPS